MDAVRRSDEMKLLGYFLAFRATAKDDYHRFFKQAAQRDVANMFCEAFGDGRSQAQFYSSLRGEIDGFRRGLQFESGRTIEVLSSYDDIGTENILRTLLEARQLSRPSDDGEITDLEEGVTQGGGRIVQVKKYERNLRLRQKVS